MKQTELDVYVRVTIDTRSHLHYLAHSASDDDYREDMLNRRIAVAAVFSATVQAWQNLGMIDEIQAANALLEVSRG